MEQNQESSLFGLSIDPVSKNHLSDAARWAKFLAIMGFIFCILIAVMGVFVGSLFESYRGRYDFRESEISTRGAVAGAAVVYIIIAVLYFFPCLFLFHFASKMKTALLSNDQNILNSSFQNLKKTFRYIGVLTIILLVFYVIIILIALAGRATTG